MHHAEWGPYELVECPLCHHHHLVSLDGYFFGDCDWVREQNHQGDDGPEGAASDEALVEWYATVGPGAHPQEETDED